MFEKASRRKLRFSTLRGDVSVEDLWDIPLVGRSGFSIDSIAKDVNKFIKNDSEESFVATTRKSKETSDAELKLEILKHVISVRLKEAEDAEKVVERKATKQKILSIIESKKDAALEGKSVDKLEEMLKSLD